MPCTYVRDAVHKTQAIESNKNSGDDRQWLTYWSIIGMMSLVEGHADQALRSLPYYYHAKLGLLVWLQLQVGDRQG